MREVLCLCCWSNFLSCIRQIVHLAESFCHCNQGGKHDQHHFKGSAVRQSGTPPFLLATLIEYTIVAGRHTITFLIKNAAIFWFLRKSFWKPLKRLIAVLPALRAGIVYSMYQAQLIGALRTGRRWLKLKFDKHFSHIHFLVTVNILPLTHDNCWHNIVHMPSDVIKADWRREP